MFSWSFDGVSWLVAEKRLVWGEDEVPGESVLVTGREEVFELGSEESF